jgi:uncharacterized repeat protein (TIGR03803 family)
MSPKGLCSGAKQLFFALFLTSIATSSAWATQERVLHNFVAFPRGATPQANLIADESGNLYGTTSNGGTYGYGTVFELLPGAGGKWNESVLYSFTGGTDGANPVAGLVLDTAGNLYGTTASGGITGQGIECTYSFTEDSCGVVFELSRGSNGRWTEQVLHSFAGYPTDGQTPVAGLVFDAAGNLYGTTNGGGTYGSELTGTVFELSPSLNGNWKETVLYSFSGGTDGGSPLAALIFDSAGNLYSTTEYGGDPNCNPDQDITTCGVVFELSPNSKGGWSESVLHTFSYVDGAYPLGALVFDTVGNLYGTTPVGPGFACNGGCGIVFRLEHDTWDETMIYNFAGASDGAEPVAGLVFDGNGNLYGTTQYGGGLASCGLGCGTVFELSPRSSGKWSERILHRFGSPADQNNDGIQPVSSVLLDQVGNVYGTTESGGNQSCYFFLGCGTVFRLSASPIGKWTPSLLYTFSLSTLGTNPVAGFLSDGAGNFFGTAQTGGAANYGIAFELTRQAGGRWKETVLHTFLGDSDGAGPGSVLVSDAAGNLYGTTTNGGDKSCNSLESCGGVIFELSPTAQGWKESVLYRFGPNNNRGLTVPMAGLVLDSFGNLYGTTVEGGSSNCGSYGCGTVYMLSPTGNGEWKKDLLYAFQGGTDGSAPYCTLTFDDQGALYGTTYAAGAFGNGTVFKLSPNASGKWTINVLYSFRGLTHGDGASAFSGVIFDKGGNLYGTTYYGGSTACSNYGGCGVVFELSPNSGGTWKEKVLHRFQSGQDGAHPDTSLSFDPAGNLYGATPDVYDYFGGGAVFKLTHTSGDNWSFEVLRHFNYGSKEGYCPVGPLIFDSALNVYGAASCGGADGVDRSGVIFELSAVSD